MATYVVGDIQGCYDELQRLLEKVRFDPAEDRLHCPGDLVNRGGQSLQTLRLLESLGERFAATIGNHDLYLLRESWKYPDAGCPNRELDRILRAPDRERLIDWLQHMPLAHWSDDHRVLMVHAGVIPPDAGRVGIGGLVGRVGAPPAQPPHTAVAVEVGGALETGRADRVSHVGYRRRLGELDLELRSARELDALTQPAVQDQRQDAGNQQNAG